MKHQKITNYLKFSKVFILKNNSSKQQTSTNSKQNLNN
ncbi:hypothetical protein C943_01816 [Mariniradius saccharolyticus AK6]|uniref:Uncharacterized protein n=1 Tax=Mariniradius saccharolyticus AK6 TaxID=1239962 RepID=M7XTQ3_9BACT|nr:hypothetical protein C943_01816 [Mariniradius saccharolyticus AK6]